MNKCDRKFTCVDCDFTFFFDKCSNEEKFCNCMPPKRFRCNQVLKEFIAVQMNQI